MKEIKILVSQIETLTGNRYEVDYNSNYGGYRLNNVPNETHCFGKSSIDLRMSKKEFVAYLEGLIGGLKFEIKL